MLDLPFLEMEPRGAAFLEIGPCRITISSNAVSFLEEGQCWILISRNGAPFQVVGLVRGSGKVVEPAPEVQIASPSCSGHLEEVVPLPGDPRDPD